MALSASSLLAAWEDGTPQRPVRKALILLSAAWPQVPLAAFSQMSMGQRDACLLSLREQLFGTRLSGLAKCPKCGEQLELAFLVDDIRAPHSDRNDLAADLASASQIFGFLAEGYRVRFRLPNSADLLAVTAAADEGATQRSLLRRCVLSVEEDSVDVTESILDDLPEAVEKALSAEMDQADPQGNVQFELNCPACGHQWFLTFDILRYLWHEIDDWARRTLREVHRLASAYGWSEREILALSANRRQMYLEMVQG